MTSIPISAPSGPSWRGLLRSSAARVLLATVVAMTGVLVWHDRAGAPERATTALTSATGSLPPAALNPAIEAEWGVRFTQIGLTADGGMVDVRWQALDDTKAHKLAEGVASIPLLVEESSNKVLYAIVMKPHAKEITVGGGYYLLYRNTGGTIHAGDKVTIRLGADEIQHVPVMGTG